MILFIYGAIAGLVAGYLLEKGWWMRKVERGELVCRECAVQASDKGDD